MPYSQQTLKDLAEDVKYYTVSELLAAKAALSRQGNTEGVALVLAELQSRNKQAA